MLSGALKLGAIPSIAPYLLPAALPELQRRFPALSLQLRETVTSNLVRELVTGDLDLILVALPIDDPEVETFHLFDDRFILATKATKRNQRLRHASAEMLAHDRLLLLEEGHCLRDQALSYCHMVTPEARESFGASSLATIVQMVANGYGITLSAGDGDRQRDPFRRRHPPVALPRAGAEARDRTRLAQDLAAQAGLCSVRGVVARGGAAAGKTRAQVARSAVAQV